MLYLNESNIKIIIKDNIGLYNKMVVTNKILKLDDSTGLQTRSAASPNKTGTGNIINFW